MRQAVYQEAQPKAVKDFVVCNFLVQWWWQGHASFCFLCPPPAGNVYFVHDIRDENNPTFAPFARRSEYTRAEALLPFPQFH